MDDKQLRAEFEAWFMREKGYPPQMDPDYRGKYLVGSAAQLHWVGWQARAAPQSQDREDAAYKRGYADGQRDADSYIKGCIA